MKREELSFERPTELFASQPPEMRGQSRDEVRLMVTWPEGNNSHHVFTDLPTLLKQGDLLVVNESATLPASLPATSQLGNIRLNLSTRFSDNLWIAEPRWSVSRPGPLPLEEGETLQIGDATAKLLKSYPGIPRLWLTQFSIPATSLMAKYGEPIHYSYAPVYPMESYQTLFSIFPGSAEMPSAARPWKGWNASTPSTITSSDTGKVSSTRRGIVRTRRPISVVRVARMPPKDRCQK